MALDIDKFTYRVMWSEEDQEFVGTCACAEFPNLSRLKATTEAALKGIRALVKSVVNDMKENGDKVPEPIFSKIQWKIYGLGSARGAQTPGSKSSRIRR